MPFAHSDLEGGGYGKVLLRGRLSSDDFQVRRPLGASVVNMADRTLSRRRKAALLDLGDQLNAAVTVERASRVASHFLGRSLAASRAGYAILDIAGGRYEVEQDWVQSGTASLVGRHGLAGFPATIETLRRREPIVVDDISREELLASDWDSYHSIGVRAVVMVPVIDHGELVGVLFAHQGSPRSWTTDEVDLTRSVADRTYAAIAKITAQEEQEILNQELVHRLKNTLSMVQSIAFQTLRGSTETAAFNAFSNRLVALGKAHDALIEQRWKAVDIATIIENIMKLHCPAESCSFCGPDLVLGSRATLSLSMILHELATNAIKYGALSNSAGRVTITWYVEGTGDSANLGLTWKERGGPLVTEPVRKGFGSRLITLGLMGAGQTERRYLAEGFEAEFRVPVARLLND
jgi:two-component sensor histidine kinase